MAISVVYSLVEIRMEIEILPLCIWATQSYLKLITLIQFAAAIQIDYAMFDPA
jgi:hypothetical protein